MIRGPLGSGKTIQSCKKLFDLMCEQPPNEAGIRPSRWVAIRNTYSDLKTTTIKDWLALYEDFGKFNWSPPPIHNLEFDLAEDGTTVRAELIFLALDRPGAIKKLRGVQATGFWLNEVKELPKPVLDMADGRHGRYPSKVAGAVRCGWHGIIGDCNAPDDDHWFNQLEQDPPDGWKFFVQPGGVIKVEGRWIINQEAENLKNLPDDYYQAMIAGKSEDWISVNLGNIPGFVAEGKAVYPEYHSTAHEVAQLEPNPLLPIYRGWDFGLTPACSFSQLGQHWDIFDELTTDRSGIDGFSDGVLDYCKSHYPNFDFIDIGDPAGASDSETDERDCFIILQGKNINIEPGLQTQTIRKGAIKWALHRMVDGKPFLRVGPKCKMIRKGFRGGYCYRRVLVQEERYADKPNKNMYSHPIEATEYPATILFGDRVKNVSQSKTPLKRPKVAVA